MAHADAYLKTLFTYWFLPFVFVLLIVYWYFDLDMVTVRNKTKAFLQYLFLGKLHGKLDREKHLLFDHFTQVNIQSKSGRNIRYDTRLLEIGAGSGRNLDYYLKGTSLTCLDPNPCHELYLRKALEKSKNKFIKLDSFVTGFAEDMSVFEDNHFDVAVSTLTLCSVQNQDAVIREVQRVLKPGGKFYFMEHVAAKKGSFGRWIQEKLDPINPYLCDGCHLNRETWSSFDRSHLFQSVSYREFSLRIIPGVNEFWQKLGVKPALDQ